MGIIHGRMLERLLNVRVNHQGNRGDQRVVGGEKGEVHVILFLLNLIK